MPPKFRPIPNAKSAVNPHAVQAKLQQALALHHQGQFAKAEALYVEVLKTQPKHFEVLHLLGLVAFQTENYPRAVDLIGKAIQLFAGNAAFHRNYAIALQKLKQPKAAAESYSKAVALKPDDAEAHFELGNVLAELKQLDAAVKSYGQAIALKPDYAEAYNNRGAALKEGMRPDLAVESLKMAIAIRPGYAEAYNNLGAALQDLNQLDAALENLNKAIAIKPDFVDAHCNKAFALLLSGQFDEGWKHYEWRWRSEKFGSKIRNFPQPLWLGTAPLTGKTILLHTEQGLGDTLQFCRYAKSVADLGARVVLEAPTVLVGQLKNLEGVTELVEVGAKLPEFDLHCPLLSLPLALNTRLNTIPSASAYMRSDPNKVKHWEQKLGSKTAPRIGLVWSGSTAHKNDRNRSIRLDALLDKLPSACTYISLQKELRDADIATLQAHPEFQHFGDDLNDFTDTAALCELMDIVISVDTSVVHLAGALGKQTWVLLPFSPDWRWLLERRDCPWYPSVQLYRQPSLGNWAAALESVRADLLKRVA